jgi:hypothetical protein
LKRNPFGSGDEFIKDGKDKVHAFDFETPELKETIILAKRYQR